MSHLKIRNLRCPLGGRADQLHSRLGAGKKTKNAILLPLIERHLTFCCVIILYIHTHSPSSVPWHLINTGRGRLETATFNKDLINVFLFPTFCTHTPAGLPLTHAFLTLFVAPYVLRQCFLVFTVTSVLTLFQFSCSFLLLHAFM